MNPCPKCKGRCKVYKVGEHPIDNSRVVCTTCHDTGVDLSTVKENCLILGIPEVQKCCADCSCEESFQPCEACDNRRAQYKKS